MEIKQNNVKIYMKIVVKKSQKTIPKGNGGKKKNTDNKNI